MSSATSATPADGGPAAAPATLQPGFNLGQYRILRLLGHGGMGEVYLAEHQILRTRYAVKIVPQSASSDPAFVARFRDEARVMAQLQHPGIVHVVYADRAAGMFYLAMDFVAADAGEQPWDLEDALAAAPGGRLAPATVLRLARQILEGLRYAHASGVVHRDLKPANVMLTSRAAERADTRVTDFGLARLVGAQWLRDRVERSVRESLAGGAAAPPSAARETRSSVRSLLGTYEYMSPEQKEGQEGDERSDMFAVGVMLYRMLTGRRLAGRAKAASEVVEGLDPAWDEVVDRCLQENPAERFASAEEAIGRLDAMAGSAAAPAAAPAAPGAGVEKTAKAPEMFITHASKDIATAERICGLLEARGVKCWIAPRNVRPGTEWAEAIVEGIEASRALLLVLSRNANRSAAVAGELEKSFSSGIPIFTVRIENVAPSKKIELFIRRTQWVDAFSGSLEEHVDRLARSVRSSLDGVSLPGVEAAAPAPGARPRLPLLWAAAGCGVALIALAAYLVGSRRGEVPAPPSPPAVYETEEPAAGTPAQAAQPPAQPPVSAGKTQPGVTPAQETQAPATTVQPSPAVGQTAARPPATETAGRPEPPQTTEKPRPPVETVQPPRPQPAQGTTAATRVKPEPKPARVLFQVKPRGATIFVDGARLDPQQGETALAEGSHALRVEKPGYETYRGTCQVAAGENKTVSVDLVPQKHTIMW